MSYLTTPNMSLQVPVVNGEPGPNYAVDVNNSLITVDAHSHLPGSGVQITPPAININGDLTYNNNRATLLKSLTFTSQTSPLSAVNPDIGALYVASADLYYNDTMGHQIRLTQNGSIVGSAGTISGLVSPATASYVSANSTFVWQSAVNTPAAMDNGPITIRNLTANSYGTTIQANASIGASYTLTLPAALPSSQQVLTVDTSGNLGYNAGTSLVPSGSVTMYTGTSAPAGYLLCDGTAYSRTTYATLFSVIGTNYGNGDGSTTFNVPDMRGMFPRGVSGTSGTDPDASSRYSVYGGNTGNNVGSIQGNALTQHTHSSSVFVNTASGGAAGLQFVNLSNQTPSSLVSVGNINSGASTSTETRPVNTYFYFIIKT